MPRAASVVVWNERAAAASAARWDAVCAQEGWGRTPADRRLLDAVFGASWYCTRFLFYRGGAAAALLDLPDPELERIALRPPAAGGPMDDPGDDPEDGLEALRIARNESLLAVLALDLRGRLPQRELETALTRLAEATLQGLLQLLARDFPVLERLVVLGLGRLAGGEMNYGSDLDLILLHPDGCTAELLRGVSRLLRDSAAATPAGRLYEIDARLRPHGSAGALVATLAAFRAHHLGPRETWERQLLTRCRLLRDPEGRAAPVLAEVAQAVYRPRPPAALRADILAMRERVERQLGGLAGELDLKHGRGGTMDVDFLAHCLQLRHGGAYAALRSAGTRQALTRAMAAGLLDAGRGRQLLEDYDFLKRVEGRLRAFDMRPGGRVLESSQALDIAARGCGVAGGGKELLRLCRRGCERVRGAFLRTLAAE